MPSGQPPLSLAAIAVIREWIDAGAPNWDVPQDITFITTDAMLTTIQQHLTSLDPFDRPFIRYFTLTHLYNAGESPQSLHAYRVGLSKLVNSLSWRFDITNPQPIDPQKTILSIDLRDYDWDQVDAWTQLETFYPYPLTFDAATQAEIACETDASA